MVNFISMAGMFFMGLQLNDFINSYISCGMAPPHIIGASHFAFRKVTFITQTYIIRYELEFAETSSRTDNYCKSKMQDSFFRAYSRVSKR